MFESDTENEVLHCDGRGNLAYLEVYEDGLTLTVESQDLEHRPFYRVKNLLGKYERPSEIDFINIDRTSKGYKDTVEWKFEEDEIDLTKDKPYAEALKNTRKLPEYAKSDSALKSFENQPVTHLNVNGSFGQIMWDRDEDGETYYTLAGIRPNNPEMAETFLDIAGIPVNDETVSELLDEVEKLL